ncbi:hypothetical protein ACFZBP_38825 [Streptomyces sp. NPDC008086]|uniref:hypothetical protein n=1 Tax=Streptomyces sp. NPDC008086 TaxID=3364807 RepID=UPI0036EF6AC9
MPWRLPVLWSKSVVTGVLVVPVAVGGALAEFGLGARSLDGQGISMSHVGDVCCVP